VCNVHSPPLALPEVFHDHVRAITCTQHYAAHTGTATHWTRYSRKGFPEIEAIGLGMSEMTGRNLVPSPPTRTRQGTCSPIGPFALIFPLPSVTFCWYRDSPTSSAPGPARRSSRYEPIGNKNQMG